MSAEIAGRLVAVGRPDRALDAEMHRLSGRQVRVRRREDAQGPWTVYEAERDDGAWGALPEYTASIDAAVTLLPKDGPDREYYATIWTGPRPAARIFYRERDPEAEGGWALGALNPWEVHGPTPAIAVCLAVCEAQLAMAKAGSAA